jgi:hypothetical protein
MSAKTATATKSSEKPQDRKEVILDAALELFIKTEQYAIYGTLTEAEIVTAQFKRDKFAIASGHGEFVLAANFDEAKARIEGVLDLLRSDTSIKQLVAM